jgi:hypothetical protein
VLSDSARTRHKNTIEKQNKTNKLHGLSPRKNYTS